MSLKFGESEKKAPKSFEPCDISWSVTLMPLVLPSCKYKEVFLEIKGFQIPPH
jgi:hypothetical protein